MNKTALIIVDMIYDFTDPLGKVFYPLNERIIEGLAEFIELVKHSDCSIIYVEHTIKMKDYLNQKVKTRECCIEGSGGEITDSRLNCDRSRDIIIKKTKYSSFYKTNLEEVLKKNRIENLIITGTKTNNCILATALDAFNRNYNTIVVSDLVGTNDEETNRIYLRDINKYIAKVMSSSEIKKLLSEGEL
ncbi:MAG: cysteine hydrolase [Tenericutes bacterium]|nr:cysteine hydrolase [Mycoplasmatota bacterium]